MPARLLAALALLVTLPGCALVNLHQETREFSSATVLAGYTTVPAGWSGPVVVAAITTERRIAHQVWLHESGGFELIVPEGEYSLLAFGDPNRNGRIDGGEPAAFLPSAVRATGSGMVPGLDLRLSVEDAATARAAAPPIRPLSTHSTQAGAIVDLKSVALSAESGRRGYWSPLQSFRQTGGNVYFLEPYDPKRIPLLLIHGAAGSAQDFRYFLEHLDRRYQPWLFLYPSGAPLDSMAYLLFWKLLNLQLRHGFERLDVVAHSMGGLVARRFVINHGAQFPQIGRLVTISTPWGGEQSATTGVEHSPAVIPSWRDMQPQGDFLKRLFAQSLPPNVRHTLLFGHRGGYSLLRPNNDGAVTLASQLLPAAQAEASLVIGFDEDHTSILQAPEVLRQVTRSLDVAAWPAGSGRLRVEQEYADPALLPSASAPPFVVLTPLDPAATTLTLPLPPGDSAMLGPLSPGDYQLTALAHGFSVQPANQRVTVTAGTTDLRLRFTPQGVLAGYVGVDGDSTTYPAGSFRPPHPDVVIQKISLRSADVTRTLVPVPGDASLVWREYVAGRDAAAGAVFSFVDLTAGEYRLEILAKGYRPYSGRFTVTPGVAVSTPPIVLTPSASR